MGGDFNCVLNSKIDKLPPDKGPITKKSRSLIAMIKEFGLIDAWHHHHPRQRDFTFRSGVHGNYSRIDSFCISKQDIGKVESCNIEPATISDHRPVTLQFKLGTNKTFKYWRLNVSMLSDPLMRERISEELNIYFETNNNGSVSASVLWDAAKAVIRGKIISMSIALKKQRLEKQLNLEKSTDGFPGKFYKCFTDQLTPVLCDVYNHALSNNDPPGS